MNRTIHYNHILNYVSNVGKTRMADDERAVQFKALFWRLSE